MKNLITLIILVAALTCNAQKSLMVGAGSTLGGIDGEIGLPSFYLSTAIYDRVSKNGSTTFEAQLVDRKFEDSGYRIESTALNIGAIYNINLFKSSFAVSIGANMGLITSNKVTVINDEFFGSKGARFGLTGGASYKIKKFDISVRYTKTINGEDPFDGYFQAGVSYDILKF
jgi:hypothetical protein